MIRKWKWACLLVVTLTLPACNRYVLNQDFEFDLPSGDEKPIRVDPIKKDQNIRVAVKANGAPVNVYIFLEKDQVAAKSDIIQKRQSDKVLAKSEKTNDVTLEASIPADNPAVILIRTVGKSAKVTVHLSN